MQATTSRVLTGKKIHYQRGIPLFLSLVYQFFSNHTCTDFFLIIQLLIVKHPLCDVPFNKDLILLAQLKHLKRHGPNGTLPRMLPSWVL